VPHEIGSHVEDFVHLGRAEIKARDILALNGVSPLQPRRSVFYRLGDQNRHGFGYGVIRFHQRGVDRLKRVRPDADFAAKRIVHCSDEKDHEAKEKRHGSAENQMDMNLHAEHRKQNNEDDRANHHDPPEDRRNSGGDIGESGPLAFMRARPNLPDQPDSCDEL
jgi:hypothetical protein